MYILVRALTCEDVSERMYQSVQCLKLDLFGKILSLAVFEGLFSTSLPTLSIFSRFLGKFSLLKMAKY